MDGSADFAVRGFEFHGNDRFQTGMWRWRSIDRAFGLMQELGLNTLIFHQNDLTDWAELPRAYFAPAVRRARWPVRAAQVENGRSHLNEAARRAAARGLRLFLEVKEMSYPDELIELHPELMVEGTAVCPTHPFWWEFQRQKYRELAADIPQLAGVIVSAGTRESKLSLAVQSCTCARCRTYSPAVWYANLLHSLFEPLQAAGKTLVVRDFAYSRAEQNLVVNACAQVSPEVVVALKNTPHDFYPPFPDNPRIGHVPVRRQWVEFDAWCQFSGMGFYPASVVEDMQRRLRHARASGVEGVTFRVDLEFMSDTSVLNSWNLVNVFAGGRLSQRVEQPLDPIYDEWMAYGVANPLAAESEQRAPAPISPAQRARVRAFMRASWQVIAKSLYVRGFNFTDGTGQYPFSIDHAFFTMLVFQGRNDWEPGANRRVEPTEENVRAILDEKDAAEREVAALPGILQVETLGVPPPLRAALADLLDLYQWYVRGLARCTAACFLVKLAERSRRPADVARAGRAADGLDAFRRQAAARLQGTFYPHFVYWYFDADYLRRLSEDVRAHLARLAPPGPLA